MRCYLLLGLLCEPLVEAEQEEEFPAGLGNLTMQTATDANGTGGSQ
jgi:hypothetical protein